jgi:hypothetical protein
LPVIHTRECHRPDLSDLPDAKRDRGTPNLRIGEPGPMGRLWWRARQALRLSQNWPPCPVRPCWISPAKVRFAARILKHFCKSAGFGI